MPKKFVKANWNFENFLFLFRSWNTQGRLHSSSAMNSANASITMACEVSTHSRKFPDCDWLIVLFRRTAILVLYLTRQLNYDDDFATVLFHIFTMFVYFFPIFGAIIADSWLGKFKTIFYLSIVYAIGSSVIALGAIPAFPLSGR